MKHGYRHRLRDCDEIILSGPVRRARVDGGAFFMTSWVEEEREKIRVSFKEMGDKERAEKEKAYLKSPYQFYGVSLPKINSYVRDLKIRHKSLDSLKVFHLTNSLWNSTFHEEKTLAIKILKEFNHYLLYDKIPFLEEMLRGATGWDHVDGISIHLMGVVLSRDERAYDYLRRWSESENFWMRRASLISQILLFREGKGDHGLFFELAEKMIEEREFFIRKAIGWTIREMSKADPERAFAFLKEVRGRASGLTLREGAKRLPVKMQLQLKNMGSGTAS